MSLDDYQLLSIKLDRGVAFVTINHPPINLFDIPLVLELDRLGQELEAADDVRVVVFDSADPDFFIAHADVEMIAQLPKDAEPPTELNIFNILIERFRTMPKATIGKIEGRRARWRQRVSARARHALRRTRQSGARSARGGSGHHSRGRWHAAPPALDGKEPSLGGGVGL